MLTSNANWQWKEKEKIGCAITTLVLPNTSPEILLLCVTASKCKHIGATTRNSRCNEYSLLLGMSIITLRSFITTHRRIPDHATTLFLTYTVLVY